MKTADDVKREHQAKNAEREEGTVGNKTVHPPQDNISKEGKDVDLGGGTHVNVKKTPGVPHTDPNDTQDPSKVKQDVDVTVKLQTDVACEKCGSTQVKRMGSGESASPSPIDVRCIQCGHEFKLDTTKPAETQEGPR